MINIAIIEDEKEFSSHLEQSLKDYFQEERDNQGNQELLPYHIDVYNSAILFLEKCEQYSIVFMDIDLPIINGLSASKELREKNENAILIYCTNYAKFAVDGYQYHASDYLIKPVHKQHLRMTMDKAIEQIESLHKNSVVISVDKGKKVVKIEEIIYIEVKGKLLYYHLTKNRTLIERKSLKEASAAFDEHSFARCNHCYLVNLDYVREYNEDFVFLSSGASLAISRNRKKEFQEKLNLYLGSQY